MNTVRELHDQAMRLAQLALVARHGGELAEAEDLARQAYDFEARAADLVPEDPGSEPTRSILYRSAASLAYQAREYAVAQRLLAKGLAGYPPPQVEQELKDLYQQINLESYLHARGVALQDDEFQISLEGCGVGVGRIIYDEFIRRMRTARTLIDRTIQRRLGAAYQRAGRIPQDMRPFLPMLSAPQVGSFTINVGLAVPENGQLPLFLTAADVIDDLLANIELVERASEQELEQRIQQKDYYRNFVALTRDLAPDGERISSVGFTSRRRSVNLTRQRSTIEIMPALPESAVDVQRSPIRIEGLLDYATARHQHEGLGLTTAEGKQYDVEVEQGLEDLVRAYFKQWVAVTGQYDGVKVYLSDIVPVDQSA